MQISRLRRHRRIATLFTIVAAMQLVLAPALRLCADPLHATTHEMSHAMSHTMHHQPAQQHHAPAGDDGCLVMRACEAVAVTPPLLVAATATDRLPRPSADVPRLESVDRAPEAPPPRA